MHIKADVEKATFSPLIFHCRGGAGYSASKIRNDCREAKHKKGGLLRWIIAQIKKMRKNYGKHKQ